LATLAMLSNRSLGSVRRYAESLVGVSWRELVETRNSQWFWEAAEMVAAWALRIPLNEARRLFQPVPVSAPGGQPIPETLPRGKGYIVLQWTNNTAHAVAFNRGLVYDPSEAVPRPWAQYVERNRSAIVSVHIVPLPRRKRGTKKP
jgi:hypothetical protein